MTGIDSGRDFYRKDLWDPEWWVEIIGVEYQSLLSAFPLAERLPRQRGGETLQVLDVGCGTGIFPTYLDKVLPHSLHLQCDLVDVSPLSLEKAQGTLSDLPHFSVRSSYELAIEDLPVRFPAQSGPYDLIWAIHSFTTVQIDRMPDVLSWLPDQLAPGGIFMVYQLAAASSYQFLHRFFRENHPEGEKHRPFMQFEDTQQILEELEMSYHSISLSFDHEVREDENDRLASYLRKCVLAHEIDALTTFAPVLPDFHDPAAGVYRFPQQVILATIEAD